MNPNNTKLDKAISDRNLIHARSIIICYIDTDVFSKDYICDKVAEYVDDGFKKHAMTIWVDDDGALALPSDQKDWTEDYWRQLVVELPLNFSKVKLSNIIKVIEYLRKIKHPKFQIEDNNATKAREEQLNSLTKQIKPEITYKSQSNSSNREMTIIVIGVVIGAVIGLVVKTAVIPMITGAIIGGALGFGKNFYSKKGK